VANVIKDSSETEAIRQQMQAVRRVLDDDVQQITEQARVMSDWRHYVKTYPWMCLGTALAVGYFVVPKRMIVRGVQPDSQTLAELAKQSHLMATANSASRNSMRNKLLSFVGKQVAGIVLSYVGQHAGRLFAPQIATSQQDDHHEESHP